MWKALQSIQVEQSSNGLLLLGTAAWEYDQGKYPFLFFLTKT